MNIQAFKAVLLSMPTLSQGQADDLKIQTPQFRVWISRMTISDGAHENNAVTIEYYDDGQWHTI